MKNLRLASAGALSVLVVLMLSFSQAAAAAPFVGQPGDWTIVGTPVVTTLGASQAAEATFDNHLTCRCWGSS